MTTRQGAETRKSGLVDPTIANLVTKDKIKQTLKRIDPEQRLDADVEDVLVDLTGEFIKTVLKSACQLAKHKRSDTLEASDAQLITGTFLIPGFGIDMEPELLKKRKQRTESHMNKVAIVREAARKEGAMKRSSRLRARQQQKQTQ